jgi:hypothetical protein
MYATWVSRPHTTVARKRVLPSGWPTSMVSCMANVIEDLDKGELQLQDFK